MQFNTLPRTFMTSRTVMPSDKHTSRTAKAKDLISSLINVTLSGMCLFTNRSSYSACINVVPLYPFDLPFFLHKVTIWGRHIMASMRNMQIAEALLTLVSCSQTAFFLFLGVGKKGLGTLTLIILFTAPLHTGWLLIAADWWIFLLRFLIINRWRHQAMYKLARPAGCITYMPCVTMVESSMIEQALQFFLQKTATVFQHLLWLPSLQYLMTGHYHAPVQPLVVSSALSVGVSAMENSFLHHPYKKPKCAVHALVL